MNTNKSNFAPQVDTLWMYDKLNDVSDKRGKITRLINSGQLIRLRRGLYATRTDLHPYSMAASIYGPSYISYETALAFHGLIPEAVYEITSATLKRSRQFTNNFGRYQYIRVPSQIYATGIERAGENELPFLIASPTKALCDRIALESGMRSMSDVRKWLELMRLNLNLPIDATTLQKCAAGYGRPAVRLLLRIVQRNGGTLS